MYNGIGRIWDMKTVWDVRDLLKRFGSFVYIGDRLAELELMEMEIQELYRSRLIENREYQQAMLILHKAKLEEKKIKR